jgi:hypothetical protein
MLIEVNDQLVKQAEQALHESGRYSRSRNAFKRNKELTMITEHLFRQMILRTMAMIRKTRITATCFPVRNSRVVVADIPNRIPGREL